MDENAKYRQDMADMLLAAQRRVARARMARQFKGDGTIFVDIARDRLAEINKEGFHEAEPMSRERYLDAHGEVRGIKYMCDMVDSYAKEEESATNEVNLLNEQLAQFDKDKSQQ